MSGRPQNWTRDFLKTSSEATWMRSSIHVLKKGFVRIRQDFSPKIKGRVTVTCIIVKNQSVNT